MFWDLVFVIYLELGTCDLEIVWKLKIGNCKLQPSYTVYYNRTHSHYYHERQWSRYP